MKFLIAGFGSIGRRHFRNLLALGERDIVLLRSFKSTLEAKELEGFPVETDLARALAHQPDAVIVATPTALHLDAAIPAVAAGCHVLLEKPVAASLDDLPRLHEAQRRTGARILVGFQYRFHPHFRRTRELLGQGAIGRPLTARAQYGEYLPGFHPWEDYRASYSARADLGGGVLLTLCHPLDYLFWFFGAGTLLWKQAPRLSDLEIQVEDVAELGFRMPAGELATVHLNFFQRPALHRFEICGTAGTLTWDQTDQVLRVFSAATGAWENTPAPAGYERNEMFLEEMRHFLRVVRGEEPPAPWRTGNASCAPPSAPIFPPNPGRGPVPPPSGAAAPCPPP